MDEHKHCRHCGEIIRPSKLDEEVADLSENDVVVLYRDLAYNNSFCIECVNRYSLDRLINWFYRGDKI